MSDPTSSTQRLVHIRDILAERIRTLRRERGWTQQRLAADLGLSQSRLSELEAGGGSFAAEHLVVLLGLFNIDLGGLGLLVRNEDAELQNALVRAGARHLVRVPDVTPSGRFARPSQVVSAVLLNPESERWVAALAPVVLWSVDDLALFSIQAELGAAGVPNRLGWLVENVVAAVSQSPPPRGAWSTRGRRAEVVFTDFLKRVRPSRIIQRDAFDRGVRSAKSWDLVWKEASPISRRWRVVTALTTADFSRALEACYASR